MKNLLRLEEIGLFLLAVYLFAQLDYPWWVLLVLFLAPDLGAIGYVGGPRIGANTYNLTHHRGLAVAIYLVGALVTIEAMQLIGVVMLAHSSLDRVFGYGLRYTDSFDHTHLGYVGKTARQMAAEAGTSGEG